MITPVEALIALSVAFWTILGVGALIVSALQ
jgi:hypothetical protein